MKKPNMFTGPAAAAIVAVVAAAALLVVTPAITAAQGVTYVRENRTQLGGALGQLMPSMPGGTAETVYIQDGMMRFDDETTSTIIDGEAGSFTYLDHDAKTHYTIDFEELARDMEQRAEGFRQEMQESVGEGVDEGIAEMREAKEGDLSDIEIRMSVRTTRPGEVMGIGDASAERVFLIIETDIAGVLDEDYQQMMGGDGAQLVLLSDLWVSTDFPGYRELTEARAGLGKKLLGSGAVERSGQALEMMFSQQEGLDVALDRSRAELDALEGVVVQSTTHFVMVAPNSEFDPWKVVDQEDVSLKDAAVGAAKDEAKDGAKDAAKSAVRSFTGGLFGGGGDEEEEEEVEDEVEVENDPGTQMVLLEFVSTIRDIEEKDLSDDLFQPPADYREISPPGLEGPR